MAFNEDELKTLRTIMYGGFKKKSVPRYDMRGAKGGRSWVQNGYNEVTNYAAYNTGLLGRVRDEVGINGVNNDDEIREIYDYISGYRQPTPEAKPEPAPPPPQTSPGFEDRLSGIQNDYNQQNDKLMEQLAADRANYESMMKKMEQRISNYQNSYNQGSGVGGQETALMINPAQSVADKSRNTSKGTQQFNRRNRNMNLKISNVRI